MRFKKIFYITYELKQPLGLLTGIRRYLRNRILQTQMTQLTFKSDPRHCNVMEYPDKLTAPNIVLFFCRPCQIKSFDYPIRHSKGGSQEPVHAGTKVLLWECRTFSYCLHALSLARKVRISAHPICAIACRTKTKMGRVCRVM